MFATFKKWLILFGICTFMGLFSFSGYQAGYLMEKEAEPVFRTLVNELTGTYTLFLLLPFILFFISRIRISKSNWFWTLPLHLVFTVIYGISHTLLMTASRAWLYPELGFGSYDLGEPYYRFLMEYHKQFLIYAAILFAVYVIENYKNYREREKKAAQLQLTAAELQSQLIHAQLQSLKGQLQPHFLFNTLNAISSIMYEDVKKADAMITRLSAMLRMLLEHSQNQKTELKHELDFLNLYLDLMRARFEDKLFVEVHTESGHENALVPNLILQPIVENAIKHNDLENSDRTKVRVRIYHEDSFLIMTVQDNGPGFNGDTAGLLSKGIGLSNTRERLQRLYGNNQRLEFSKSPEGGLQVVIRIPYESLERGVETEERPNP
jgi:sensor histidine kinase YesM